MYWKEFYKLEFYGEKTMLEKMRDFFEARLDGYDEHMLTNIESATEFYPFTAKMLPSANSCRILDLGCGTGLELEEYFLVCPTAKVTGVDLSQGMLSALKKKFTDKDITLIVGSYFDVPFGKNEFDAAVSVESLHHFTKEEKVPLYSKLHDSLKENGYFILTDYFASSDDEEKTHRQKMIDLKAEQGICDDEFYHFDTPLTVKHETEALIEAGFSKVEVLNNWGATYTLKALK
jgi:tRNA (cmo5U34)-methyltransferase